MQAPKTAPTEAARRRRKPAAHAAAAPDAPPAESAAEPPPLPFRIVNWIGMIDQLASTAANRRLRDLDLTLTDFVMLNHFSHRPEEGRTVGRIAAALQQPQPGVTKTAQKLAARGWLRETPNPADGRSKILHLTPAGGVRHRDAIARLAPDLAAAFDGWSAPEMAALFAALDRLKVWFDAARD